MKLGKPVSLNELQFYDNVFLKYPAFDDFMPSPYGKKAVNFMKAKNFYAIKRRTGLTNQEFRLSLKHNLKFMNLNQLLKRVM